MQPVFLYLAPVQGITDYIFRNTYFKHFCGISKAFTPFIRIQNGMVLKKAHMTDIDPAYNDTNRIVPQLLSNNSDEMIFFADFISDYGYLELNWNLGCPFPMVVNQTQGSGLLPFPDKIENILDKLFSKVKIRISVKMRLGSINEEEIFPLLDIFKKYPLSEIIIHPRLGVQMYTGSVNHLHFEKCIHYTSQNIVYNGDIKTLDDFKEIRLKYPSITKLMIGRGIFSNPFLAEQILNTYNFDSDKLERFSEFHNELFMLYQQKLSGPGHLLQKMLQFWEYFSQ